MEGSGQLIEGDKKVRQYKVFSRKLGTVFVGNAITNRQQRSIAMNVH